MAQVKDDMIKDTDTFSALLLKNDMDIKASMSNIDYAISKIFHLL